MFYSSAWSNKLLKFFKIIRTLKRLNYPFFLIENYKNSQNLFVAILNSLSV